MSVRLQQAGSTVVKYTYFFNIKTEHYGGAVCDYQNIETRVEHTFFERVETVTYNGGAIYKKNGNLSVSYCCFLLCSSGNKGEGCGGNAIYFTGSQYAISVGYSSITQSAAESKSDPGDASIYTNLGKLTDLNFLNGTQNFGRFSSGGNLLVEMLGFSTASLKYSHITECKGTRVATGDHSVVSEIISCNIINNTINAFVKEIKKIRECYIFLNKLSNKPTGFNFESCKSDNTYICNPKYNFVTKELFLIEDNQCLANILLSDANNYLPAYIITLSFLLNSINSH